MQFIIFLISIFSFWNWNQFNIFLHPSHREGLNVSIQECLVRGIPVVTTNKISADQKIRITADEMQVEQEGQIIKAKGNAIAQDEKGVKMKSDLIMRSKKGEFF